LAFSDRRFRLDVAGEPVEELAGEKERQEDEGEEETRLLPESTAEGVCFPRGSVEIGPPVKARRGTRGASVDDS
jgi:hypothetical protein